MATLKIEITAPNSAFANYADDLGYSSLITSIVEGQAVSEPNPQTKQEYLTEKIKGIVSSALAEKSSFVIKQTKEDEARTAIIANRTSIEGVMTVTIS